MNMTEMIEDFHLYPNTIKKEINSDNSAGEIARETIMQNIGIGAGFCARVGKSVWERCAYVDPRTEEAGIVHQIIGGRAGTTWNKFYRTIIAVRD